MGKYCVGHGVALLYLWNNGPINSSLFCFISNTIFCKQKTAASVYPPCQMCRISWSDTSIYVLSERPERQTEADVGGSAMTQSRFFATKSAWGRGEEGSPISILAGAADSKYGGSGGGGRDRRCCCHLKVTGPARL